MAVLAQTDPIQRGAGRAVLLKIALCESGLLLDVVDLMHLARGAALPPTPGASTNPLLSGPYLQGLLRGKVLVIHLHRLIVTSATYRRSSHGRPDLQEMDPLNQSLARQTRLRVEAETVRDLALGASGLLVRHVGGPSVYPPQPDGVYAFTQRKAAWPTSQGADRYRRGMYTFFMRSAPHPLFETFDAPKFNTTCTRRVRSNTPLQAMAIANDAAMIEMARALARRALTESEGSDADRVRHLFRLCLTRPPQRAEAA